MNRSRWTSRFGLVVLLGALGACDVLPDVQKSRYDRCDSPGGEELRVEAERLQAQDDREGALAALRELVTECPDYVPGHRSYIEYARRIGGEAEKAMERYYLDLKDRPDSPVVPYVKAAVVPSEQERLALLEESTRRDSSFHWGFLSLGRVMQRPSVRKPGQALEQFAKAVAVAPDCAPCNLEYAEALAEVGRVEEAELHYRRVLELRPYEVGVTKAFVQLLVHGSFPTSRRMREARRLVDELLERDPRDSDLWMMRAAISWHEGQWLAARDDYRKVIELRLVDNEPADAMRAVLNLGNLYYHVLPEVDPGGRAEWWPKARDAYTYFVRRGEADGVLDFVDLYVAIPYRLQLIADELGPLPEDHVPTPLETF
jgi:tetratricopeptide (TPR) repeat protein